MIEKAISGFSVILSPIRCPLRQILRSKHTRHSHLHRLLSRIQSSNIFLSSIYQYSFSKFHRPLTTPNSTYTSTFFILSKSPTVNYVLPNTSFISLSNSELYLDPHKISNSNQSKLSCYRHSPQCPSPSRHPPWCSSRHRRVLTTTASSPTPVAPTLSFISRHYLITDPMVMYGTRYGYDVSNFDVMTSDISGRPVHVYTFQTPPSRSSHPLLLSCPLHTHLLTPQASWRLSLPVWWYTKSWTIHTSVASII